VAATDHHHRPAGRPCLFRPSRHAHYLSSASHLYIYIYNTRPCAQAAPTLLPYSIARRTLALPSALATWSVMAYSNAFLFVVAFPVASGGSVVEARWYGRPGKCSPVEALVSEQLYSSIFLHKDDAACPAKGFYTYSSFIRAARTFPKFAGTGDLATRKREIAAFFAQISHETTGARHVRTGFEQTKRCLSRVFGNVRLFHFCCAQAAGRRRRTARTRGAFATRRRSVPRATTATPRTRSGRATRASPTTGSPGTSITGRRAGPWALTACATRRWWPTVPTRPSGRRSGSG
jgi:hypothetical protein